MLRMTAASDGVSECAFPMRQTDLDTYKLEGCDETSSISSPDRPMPVDLWLIFRHLRSPVHVSAQTSPNRLRPKPSSLHALFELLQLGEALFEQQKLVPVGGNRVVEVVELARHQLVLRVVLPQAGELFDVLAELVVHFVVGDFEVAATTLVESGLLVLVLLATATALLLLLLALMGPVRTFFGGFAIHWSVCERHYVDIWE
jgi:hypothetical protein